MNIEELQNTATNILENLDEILSKNLKGEGEDSDPQLNYLKNTIFEVQKCVNGIEEADMSPGRPMYDASILELQTLIKNAATDKGLSSETKKVNVELCPKIMLSHVGEIEVPVDMHFSDIEYWANHVIEGLAPDEFLSDYSVWEGE